jgi:hypothetical protein
MTNLVILASLDAWTPRRRQTAAGVPCLVVGLGFSAIAIAIAVRSRQIGQIGMRYVLNRGIGIR